MFAIFIIAMLFCWQVQQRSLCGFPMTMCGRCFTHAVSTEGSVGYWLHNISGSSGLTTGSVAVPNFLDTIEGMQCTMVYT